MQDEGSSALRLRARDCFGAILLRFQFLYAGVLKEAFGVGRQYNACRTEDLSAFTLELQSNHLLYVVKILWCTTLQKVAGCFFATKWIVQ